MNIKSNIISIIALCTAIGMHATEILLENDSQKPIITRTRSKQQQLF